jgi:hypothetical protein
MHWNVRTRRLLFLVITLVVLTFPLVSSLLTRHRVETDGQDVTATVRQAARDGDSYLVAFRLPESVDPEQRTFAVKVDQAAYAQAASTHRITVRVLAGRPTAHRVAGQIDSNAPYVVTAVGDAVVLLVGLWWVRVGRRRPTVRMRAADGLEEAGPPAEPGLSRTGTDLYVAVGKVASVDGSQAVLDVGDRTVVVLLPSVVTAEVGSTVRATGALIG